MLDVWFFSLSRATLRDRCLLLLCIVCVICGVVLCIYLYVWYTNARRWSDFDRCMQGKQEIFADLHCSRVCACVCFCFVSGLWDFLLVYHKMATILYFFVANRVSLNRRWWPHGRHTLSTMYAYTFLSNMAQGSDWSISLSHDPYHSIVFNAQTHTHNHTCSKWCRKNKWANRCAYAVVAAHGLEWPLQFGP